MINITITTAVADVGYRFDTDNRIQVYINLAQPVVLPDGKRIIRLDAACIRNAGEVALGPADIIECQLNDTGCTVTLLKSGSEHKTALVPHRCPSCGSDLVTIDGHRCCINRSCPVQMTNNILMFTSSIGLSFDSRTSTVLDALLRRGALLNPVALFTLPLDELMSLHGVTTLSAQLFQQYVHSIRGGKVDVITFLRSLRIPTWTDEDCLQIASLFNANSWGLLHIGNLNHRKVRAQLPAVRWKAWDVFTAVPANKYLVSELSEILYS